MPRSTTPRPVIKKAVSKSAPRKAKVAQPVSASVAPPPAPKAEKLKTKLVRDSFTMPAADFALIAALKDRALAFQRPAKKSELLRAGLHALQLLDDTKLRKALDTLTPLKVGRPKKDS